MSPVYLIGKTAKHFSSSKTRCKAILVCPYWASAKFYLSIVAKFIRFVKYYYTIKDARRYIKLADYKKSYIGSE